VDRRELAFIAVERTHMPMVVTDLRQTDNPTVMANRAFLDLTGYEAHEVIGRNCRFLQGPDTCQIAVAEIRASIAEGRSVTTELLNYRKDGSTFWNELHLSPIRDDKDEIIYVFGSQRDVSERRAAQALAASEHRLLREVDHRAMNVLALVDGIVRLSRADDAPHYAASIQRRVQSLAKAHALLSRYGWHAVPLGELFSSQVEAFGLSRIRLSGPDIRLAATLVQPLALVVHELVANAASHGALSDPQGALTILWSSQRAAKVEVAWSETGGPPPAAQRVRGFGWTVIDTILKRQLGGAMRQIWDNRGLKVEMSFPTHPPSVLS
jgi:PAS domain S-box-containing protein